MLLPTLNTLVMPQCYWRSILLLPPLTEDHCLKSVCYDDDDNDNDRDNNDNYNNNNNNNNGIG